MVSLSTLLVFLKLLSVRSNSVYAGNRSESYSCALKNLLQLEYTKLNEASGTRNIFNMAF